MKTIIVQIGNSDNKLSQQGWAEFIREINSLLASQSNIHFAGGSSPEKPWQNYCWVAQIFSMDGLESHLERIRKNYLQDSIALTIGETKFI